MLGSAGAGRLIRGRRRRLRGLRRSLGGQLGEIQKGKSAIAPPQVSQTRYQRERHNSNHQPFVRARLVVFQQIVQIARWPVRWRTQIKDPSRVRRGG